MLRSGPMDSCIEVISNSGTLLIIDPSQRAAMSEEVRYWLGAFTDPDGKTQIVGDFEQPWAQVWRRASAEIDAFAAFGRFIVIKGEPGRYFMRISFETAVDPGKERIRESAVAQVSVQTGRLEISDGTDVSSVLDLPIGDYSATVSTLSTEFEESQTVGVFGNVHHPSILVSLKPVVEHSPNISLVRWKADGFPLVPSAGLLCRAQVKKVEDGVAILRLQTSERTWSGYGRLRVTAGVTFTAGTKLLIQLHEYTGSWWWCELPVPAA